MFRCLIYCCTLILVLSACTPAPVAAPPATVRTQSTSADMPVSLNAQQYQELSIKTILEELEQGSQTALQAYLDWGRSQPEYFPGSRNAIGQALIQAARGRRDFKVSAARIAEIEAVLRTPARTVMAEAYQPIDFTRDQGVHPSKLAEWWYYTGHLNTPEGTPYGFELCYFRVAPVIYFAHMAITDEKNQRFTYERNFYRPSAVALARDKNQIRYGNVVSDQVAPFGYQLSVPVGKYQLKLQLSAEKAPLQINGNGLIDMPEGLDSYYYSLTRLKTTGTLESDGESVPVTGQAWMDHQWGHFVALRIGWDWFSFQMEDGSEYNLFGFRKRNGQKLERYVNAFTRKGQPLHSKDFKIERLQWWRSPHTGRLYVTRWRVHLPQTGETFEVEAVQPDQELAAVKAYDLAPTYWEGRCRIVKILPDGTRVLGVGYTEHFDYTRQIDAD